LATSVSSLLVSADEAFFSKASTFSRSSEPRVKAGFKKTKLATANNTVNYFIPDYVRTTELIILRM
jgi:hypothetical protein